MVVNSKNKNQNKMVHFNIRLDLSSKMPQFKKFSHRLCEHMYFNGVMCNEALSMCSVQSLLMMHLGFVFLYRYNSDDVENP